MPCEVALCSWAEANAVFGRISSKEGYRNTLANVCGKTRLSWYPCEIVLLGEVALCSWSRSERGLRPR